MPHVIVLGGLFAGCHATKILRKEGVDVTLVLSLSHAYYNCAAPRLLVQPDLIDKTLFSLKEYADKHGAKFVQAAAVAARLDQNEVDVRGETEQTLSYDYLVVATGTRSGDLGFKVNGLAQEAVGAIREWSDKIKNAETVGILGAGPTGVECAGEIAHDLGKKAVLYSALAPLDRFNLPGAQAKLANLGVEVVQVRYERIVPGPSGSTVEFEDGLLRTFDVVLNTTHYTPSLEFLPDEVKNEKGFVVTDERLVVKGFENVLALGDIVAGAAQLVVDLKFGQLPVFAATAKSDIAGLATKSKAYAPVTSTVLVPISRTGGEGRLFGWWVPNIVVRFLKSRDFMISQAPGDFT